MQEPRDVRLPSAYREIEIALSVPLFANAVAFRIAIRPRVLVSRLASQDQAAEKKDARPLHDQRDHCVNSTNPLRSHSPQRMSDEFIHQMQESNHVRCLRVRVEGRLIDPFRVKIKDVGFTYLLIEMYPHAARLRSSRLEKASELFSQWKPFSGLRLQADE